METIVKLLRQSDLFSDLPEAKIRQLASIGRTQKFDAGETIIEAGEPSGDLYVVQSGMVEVLVTAGVVPDILGAPELTPVVQLGQGQVFGEMALVDEGARSATIRSIGDGATLFILPRAAFWSLCDADHHIGYVVTRNIARDLSFKLRHRNLPRLVCQ